MQLEDYQIIEEIAQGGYSQIYLCAHKRTGMKVAIKEIKLHTDKTANETEYADRVYREIALLRLISHPFICELFHSFAKNDSYYLVMEMEESGTLTTLINKEGPLSEDTARDYFAQMISAIRYLHQNKIVHRDLKTDNLLLDRNKNIRLIDFGLSNICKGDSLFSTACGTASYAPPEVISAKSYGFSVDIWSAGIVLFAMCTGRLPFYEANTKKMYEKILYQEPVFPTTMSPSLVDLLRKMLTKNPESRITIEEITKHPWFLQSQIDYSQIKVRELDMSLVQKLSNYGYDQIELLDKLQNGIQCDEVIAYKIAYRHKFVDYINAIKYVPRQGQSELQLIHSKQTQSAQVFAHRRASISFRDNSKRPSMIVRANQSFKTDHNIKKAQVTFQLKPVTERKHTSIQQV